MKATANESSQAVSAEQPTFKSLGWTVALGVLLSVLFWSYWNTLSRCSTYWTFPQYSHGNIVPLFAVILLWLRRDLDAPWDRKIAYIGGGLAAVAAGLFAVAMQGSMSATMASALELGGVQLGTIGALLLVQQPLRMPVDPLARWAGLGLLAFSLVVRMLSTMFPNVSPEMYSFVTATIGLFLLVGGWPAFRWAGPALAFLAFMFPLPTPVDGALLPRLQSLATAGSTYCLQTLGVPSVNEQNKIFLNANIEPLEVVEACSGLRMLTVFIALSVAIVLVTDRPWWEKLVIVASAIPIALIVNIIRITATGLAYLTVGKEAAEGVFHDVLGWAMIPIALGFLYVEFQLLSHLFIEEDMAGPMPMGVKVPQSAGR